MPEAVFTIGHSTNSITRLIELLKMHDISAVSDVRSQPYSRMNPQFNRETLKAALNAADMKYVFLGRELGARSDDKACYCNGRVVYERLGRTNSFKEGIERVITGAKQYRIALMCAERDPLDCHRTILVARHLIDRGISVRHILSNGTIEEHGEAMARLVGRLQIPATDMFRSESEILDQAYAQQESLIAYQEPSDGSNSSPSQDAKKVAG
jgi:uncharacterized protein (DUF488 family)